MKNTNIDPTLNLNNTFFQSKELNGHSKAKKNLYILIHSGDKNYDWVVDSSLSNELNIISLYYDLHNSYKIKNFAKLLVAQLAVFIAPNKNSLIMGHSFNGYLAYQIGCIVPQISYCILIDTYNYFKHEKFPASYGFDKTAKTILTHIFKNKDYKFPLYLAKTLFYKLITKKEVTDNDFIKGIEYLKEKIKQNQLINNCIYFQASRSFPGIHNHGESWKPYVKGDFLLINLNANHLTILQEHSSTITTYIETIMQSNKNMIVENSF